MEIEELQNKIREIYLEHDRRRGINAIFNHLMEEVDELRQAIENNDKTNIEEEIADVLAFLVTIANMYDVDIEKATVNKVLRTRKGITKPS